ERSALGLRLNEAGQKLLPYAETIVANADRATSVIEALTSNRTSTLRVAVTPTLPPTVLCEAIGHFRERFPAVKLVFTSGFFSDCVPKLLTDKLDLALVMTGRHQHDELLSLAEEPLCLVDQGVVGAPDHPIFDPGADLKTEFVKSRWLTTLQDETFLMERLGAFGLNETNDLSLTLCDFYSIDALNGAKGALSLSPLSVVEDPRYEGRLRALEPEKFPLPPLTISFFRRKAVELSTAGEYMRFSIRQSFEAWYAATPRMYVRPA
ncbi:MAG: LysR family transcriptional regulator, partial [Sutterellaceae bacterium]|nr:LysR family transcriptional regulator [Sutterellaceae bacterium]